MSEVHASPNMAYDIEAKGCRVTAEYLEGSRDARITFYVGAKEVGSVLYPSYRIWNIAAHFEHDNSSRPPER
jgi:hypothetical protein